jgi:hypothetical protein
MPGKKACRCIPKLLNDDQKKDTVDCILKLIWSTGLVVLD